MHPDRRGTRRAPTVGLLALGLVASCARAQPASAPAPVPTAPGPVAPAFDVAAVPRPPGVTLTVRLGHAEESRKALALLIGDAFPRVGAVTMRGLAQMALGDALTDVLDLSQPIDLAMEVVGRTTGSIALSAAVTRIDQVKSDLAEDFRLSVGPGGVIALAPLPSAGKGTIAEHCALRPAFGAATYRLVCATDAAFLASVGAYLTQTVTREEMHGDVRAVLQMSALAPGLADDAGDDDGSRATGERLARALVLSPLAELTHVTLDASVNGRAGEGTLSVDLDSANSPLLKMGVALARRPEALPEVFWRLPADADYAVVSRGVAASDYGDLRSTLSKVVRDAAGTTMAPAAQDRITRLFDETFFTGGPLLVAHGFDAEAARAALGLAAPTKDDARAAEADALASWLVFEVDEPIARWTHAVDELRAIGELDAAAARERTGAAAPAKKAARKRTFIGVPPVTAAAELPARTVHFVSGERLNPAAEGRASSGESAPFASTTHVFIVPDAGRTWIAIGRVERVLLAKLHAVLGRGAGGETLADRPGMELLREARGNLAGFVTVAAFAAKDVPAEPAFGHDRFKTRARLDVIHDLPEHGATPIPFVLGGDVDGGAARRLSIRARLSRSALAEWIGLEKR